MRAAHNRADNAINSGLDTIDRQFKSTREIVAGTRRHYAERFAGAAHGIGAERDHAVTANHHQVVIFVSTVPGVQQELSKLSPVTSITLKPCLRPASRSRPIT